MEFKGILVDIDDCLYSYERSHNVALSKVLEYLSSNMNIEKSLIEKRFEEARLQIHDELAQTPSSHNRLLYFQRMLEIFNRNPVVYALEAYNMYWDVFIENTVLYEGVEEFFDINNNKKICFITDLTADVQHKKILSLKLERYLSSLVTSEEAGKEKPHPHIFNLALKKIGLNPEDVCMIGDNFEKDIMGARAVGIKAFWLNSYNESREIKDDHIKQFGTFKEITEFFKNG